MLALGAWLRVPAGRPPCNTQSQVTPRSPFFRQKASLGPGLLWRLGISRMGLGLGAREGVELTRIWPGSGGSGTAGIVA